MIAYLKLLINGYTLLFKVAIFLMIAFTLTVVAVNPGNASAITLKDSVVLDTSNIHLGDIFDGLERDEERILGAAPQPGTTMTLNARTLMRVAVALDLPWRPSSTADQITLRRSASIVDSDTIQNALSEELEEEGVEGKFRLVIPEDSTSIILPPNEPPTVEIKTLRYKPETQWFEATLVAPTKDNPVKTLQISGKVEPLMDIPVLTESFRNGMIIGARDIRMIEMPAHAVKHEMIINPEELIGMTPRRSVMAGETLNTTDIIAPQIVSRGEMVTMIFREGPLYLTAMGKALENGAKGDTVRVVNSASNKTVQALVTASKEVTVTSN